MNARMTGQSVRLMYELDNLDCGLRALGDLLSFCSDLSLVNKDGLGILCEILADRIVVAKDEAAGLALAIREDATEQIEGDSAPAP